MCKTAPYFLWIHIHGVKIFYENVKDQIQGMDFLRDGKSRDWNQQGYKGASILSVNICFLQNFWSWVMCSQMFVVLWFAPFCLSETFIILFKESTQPRFQEYDFYCQLRSCFDMWSYMSCLTFCPYSLNRRMRTITL